MSTLKLNKEKQSYQIYVTDALMAIAENTTHLVGMQGVVDYGKTIKERWINTLNPPEETTEDNRPCEEIATDMWERIRGK